MLFYTAFYSGLSFWAVCLRAVSSLRRLVSAVAVIFSLLFT